MLRHRPSPYNQDPMPSRTEAAVHDVSTGAGHWTVPPSLPPRVPVPVGGAAARLPLVALGARPPSELTSSKGFKGGAATTVVDTSDHAATACGAATAVAVAGGGATSSFPIGVAKTFGSRHRPWPVSVDSRPFSLAAGLEGHPELCTCAPDPCFGTCPGQYSTPPSRRGRARSRRNGGGGSNSSSPRTRTTRRTDRADQHRRGPHRPPPSRLGGTWTASGGRCCGGDHLIPGGCPCGQGRPRGGGACGGGWP